MEYINADFYHQGLPGLSASDIKLIWRSPAHFREQKIQPSEPTPAMELGRAVHMAVLEPDRFAGQYKAIDDTDILAKIGGARPRATNRYKEWYAELLLDNPDKTFLELGDYNRALDMARTVRGHRVAGKLLSEPGVAETTLQWKHRVTKTPMKCRPDWLTESGKIVDLKTTEDARPTAFSRTIWTYLYHLQAAVYIEGVKETTDRDSPFIFIAVEKEPPYGLMVYELDQETVDLAMSEVDRCIRLYEECSVMGVWPAYRAEVRQIQLPHWADVTEVA